MTQDQLDIGWQSVDLGQLTVALKSFRAVLADENGEPPSEQRIAEALAGLGKVALLREDYALASRFAEEALVHDEWCAEAKRVMARVAQHDSAGAQSWLREAGLEPEIVQPHTGSNC